MSQFETLERTRWR